MVVGVGSQLGSHLRLVAGGRFCSQEQEKKGGSASERSARGAGGAGARKGWRCKFLTLRSSKSSQASHASFRCRFHSLGELVRTWAALNDARSHAFDG